MKVMSGRFAAYGTIHRDETFTQCIVFFQIEQLIWERPACSSTLCISTHLCRYFKAGMSSASMSYNFVFDSDVSDTSSQDSAETIIFNPSLCIHNFSRNGSWSVFPPPNTPSPANVAANHNPLLEVGELPPLGSEPKDPTLRVLTSVHIDTTRYIESSPPAYTSHPIYDTTLARGIKQPDRRIGVQRASDVDVLTSLDSPGSISLGQRIAQAERTTLQERSRRVRFGGTTEDYSQPWVWPQDSSSDGGDEEENLSTSTLLNDDRDIAESMERERLRDRWYNREQSHGEEMESSWWMRWRHYREDCMECMGACVVM